MNTDATKGKKQSNFTLTAQFNADFRYQTLRLFVCFKGCWFPQNSCRKQETSLTYGSFIGILFWVFDCAVRHTKLCVTSFIVLSSMAKLSAIEIYSPGLHTSHFDTSKVEFILSGNDKLHRRFWNINIVLIKLYLQEMKTERWKKRRTPCNSLFS